MEFYFNCANLDSQNFKNCNTKLLSTRKAELHVKYIDFKKQHETSF